MTQPGRPEQHRRCRAGSRHLGQRSEWRYADLQRYAACRAGLGINREHRPHHGHAERRSNIYSVTVTASDGTLRRFGELQLDHHQSAGCHGAHDAGDFERERHSPATQINLSWGASTDNVGVTGYQIERCQGAGCSNFTALTTVTTTTYSNTGLTKRPSYSYRVRATDAAGNSQRLFERCLRRLLPTRRRRARRRVDGDGGYEHADQPELDRIDRQRGRHRLSDRALPGRGLHRPSRTLITVTTTSYSNTGLTAGTSYSYRVRAADAAGNLSAYSSTASATTQAAIPAGLAAAYAFNEGTGTSTVDASGNSNTGFLSGATWTTPGQERRRFAVRRREQSRLCQRFTRASRCPAA